MGYRPGLAVASALAVLALASSTASATVLVFETADGSGNAVLGEVAAAGVSDFVPAPARLDVPSGRLIRGRHAGWVITGSSNGTADGMTCYIDCLLGDRRVPSSEGKVVFVFREVQIDTIGGDGAHVTGSTWCDPPFPTAQPTPLGWMVNTWPSACIYADCEGWQSSALVGSIKPDTTVTIDPFCGNEEVSSPGVTRLLFRFREVVIDTVDQDGNHLGGEAWSDSQFTTPQPTPVSWRANTGPTGQLHGRYDGVELTTALGDVVPDTTWWVDPDGNTWRTATPGVTEVLFVFPQTPSDAEGPVTSASFVSGESGISAEITARDLPDPGGSGVKEIHYVLDGGAEVVVPGDAVQFAVNGDGRHTLEAWAVDNAGNVGAHVTAETQTDTTPPAISRVTARPPVLWPPNGRMRCVTVTVEAVDGVDPAPTSRIISVTSNEDRKSCHGPKAKPDWIITGDLTVNLRAERNPRGAARIYTITVECMDASGNASTGTVEVRVPRDWRHRRNGARHCGVLVTSASVLPTATGAEVVFALSGPADVSVTVLNLAGRPVRRVAVERPASAGLNSLVWNGLSDTGLRAPAGTYLVEIRGDAETGVSNRLLTTLRLER